MKYSLLLRIWSTVAPCTILLLTGLSTVVAEEPDRRVTVVVTANRFDTPSDEIGSSHTVISSEKIQASQHSTVLELLRNVPGVEVVQVGGPGKTVTVFLRGADSDQTLVLIDGVRVNSPNSGLYDFADLNTANVSRIEIVRGPQSVLYGSEAVGGVINILTKQGNKGLSLYASAAGGTHKTREYSTGLQYGDDLFSHSTELTYMDTDGFSAAQEKNGNLEDDEHRNVSVATRTDAQILEDGSLNFNLRYSDSQTDLDDFDFIAGPVDSLTAEQEREFFSGGLSVSKPLSEKVNGKIEIGYLNEQLTGKDSAVTYNNFRIKSNTFSVTPKVDAQLFENNVLVAGYTYEDRHGENLGNFDENRDFHSAFIQDQHTFSDWLFLTGGVRHDDDSQFGGETTARGTVSARIMRTGSRIHASVGSGFKAPTFNELHFPDFGNPELSPERSLGFDVGVDQSIIPDRLNADVTFFYNEFDNLISFDTATFVAQNISEADALGIEAQINFNYRNLFQAALGYTWTDSEDKDTGLSLPRRADHRGSLDIIISPIDALDLSATLLIVRDRIDTGGAVMENYERIDLAAQYNYELFTPFVRIENLFDEDYEEVPGYGTPGLVVFAGLKVRT